MKCSLMQLDFLAGDLQGNARMIVESARAEDARGIDLCIFPELALIGYVPCDFLRYPAFLEAAEKLAGEICVQLADCNCALVFGGIGMPEKGGLFNRAYFIHQGMVLGIADKQKLEAREKIYFSEGSGSRLMEFGGKRFLISLGRDYFMHEYDLTSGSIDALVNIANDAFIVERREKKCEELTVIAQKRQAQVFYVNAAGACDSTIFAGGSFWGALKGEMQCAGFFDKDVIRIDTDRKPETHQPGNENEQELIFRALVCGIREYCRKTGQKKIYLGLSGGVDSALVAVLACKALKSENVIGLLMPSPWSSDHSVADALSLAANLGMKTVKLPIDTAMNAYDSIFGESFAGLARDVTEENLQARIRGDLVMAFANKFGGIALATGNKSEIAVGYCTMYGDTCGALEPIGDLYKTEVYALSRWINGAFGELIPDNILTKAPSAELRPGQKDSDSLPPYDMLDAILAGLLDRRQDIGELTARGFPADIVKKVARLVAKSQFKRVQTAPALQVHVPVWLKMPVAGCFPFLLHASETTGKGESL